MINETLQQNVISGKVANIEHRDGTMSNGAEYVGGTVEIEVGEDNIIPVSFFATKMKKDGSPNPIYPSLQTVINDYKTIASHGRDEADSVDVGAVRLQENTFFVRDGHMIRGWQFSSPFFNRRAGAESKGEFTVVGEVVDTEDEIINDVPTGNMIVRMMLITYGNTANIIDFAVEGEKAVSYVKANFTPGVQVKISGDILIVEKIEEKTSEAAFGDPIVEQIRTVDRKLLIKSATAPTDSPITEEQRETILAERESKIAETKERFLQKQKGAKKSANFSL